MRYLIGIFSAFSYEHRRNICRKTWIKKHLDIDLIFIIGNPTIYIPKRNNDILILPCSDKYYRLPQKIKGFCQWALENKNWDYLFKADDDTFIVLDRLINYIPIGDYIGCEPGGQWKGYASGGAGYILSHKSAKIISEKFNYTKGAEDFLVGKTLYEHGIKFIQDNKFHPYIHNELDYPNNDNDIISCHIGNNEQLQRQKEIFYNISLICNKII
jgi:hypothetical protein